MKKRRISRCFSLIAAILAAALPVASACTVHSSSYIYREGVTFAGTIVPEACPLEVTSERLTFSIGDLSESSAGEVTAEYTFRNPAASPLEVRFAFPCGLPSFSEEETFGTVTADGKEVACQTRYTYTDDYEFSPDHVRLLRDERVTDDFYHEDLIWRTHVLNGSFENAKDTYLEADLWYDPVRTKIVLGDAYSYRVEAGYLRLVLRTENARFESLGEAPRIVRTALVAAEDLWDEEAPREEIVPSVSSEESTFSEVVRGTRPQEVGEIDWYNACVGYLENDAADGTIGVHPSDLSADRLMRWYDYTLTFGAGETRINAVTAPLYPTVLGGTYRFESLLSPAARYAAFGELTVEIETSREVTETSLPLEKTASGYRCTRGELPLGEFIFEMGDPTVYGSDPADIFETVLGVIFIAGPIVLAAVLITVLAVSAKKKKKR